jgi:hypothetical protein
VHETALENGVNSVGATSAGSDSTVILLLSRATAHMRQNSPAFLAGDKLGLNPICFQMSYGVRDVYVHL